MLISHPITLSISTGLL
uniref:Uncharacterized protein n=1 Tax=Anguilla anguilla TaxID=7936 RepID=A0A0E9W260_ANGAN